MEVNTGEDIHGKRINEKNKNPYQTTRETLKLTFQITRYLGFERNGKECSQMKRFWITAFAVLLSFALLGCTKQESSYIVNRNGTEYHVDTENKTISDDLHTYHYKFSGDASSFSITITYPDGSSYWRNQSEGHWTGGWSDDYDESAYVSADTLVDILQEKAPKRVNSGKITGMLILIALGVFNVVLPYASWYLGYGWRYKNAEPSEASLIGYRITGAIAIIIGIILLLI